MDDFKVEVDGKEYEIKTHRKDLGNTVEHSFSTVIDGKEMELKAKMTSEVISSLKRLARHKCGKRTFRYFKI